MILSHKHRFVFIKGKKVAGTSAEIALSQICGPDDIITPITPTDERYRSGTAGEPRNYASHLYPRPFRRSTEARFLNKVRGATSSELASIGFPRSRFFNHMDLRTVLRLVPEAAGYEILCVERSPYAKVMSLANWLANRRSYAEGGELPKQLTNLQDAVEAIIADGKILRVRNVDRYRNASGAVQVTQWTTDNLAEDLERFFAERGVPAVPVADAKRGANSGSIDPAQVLRRDQIATINHLFAEEFALFGWPVIA